MCSICTRTGLTTGASETDFAPNEPCSAQMYAAFLLRALGYSEAAGDFSYAAAVASAQDYGVYDPAVIDCADFERGDVVMASYTALSCAPKGADGTLLDRLVQDGAVDAQSAQPVQALFASYAQYRADTAGDGRAAGVHHPQRVSRRRGLPAQCGRRGGPDAADAGDHVL